MKNSEMSVKEGNTLIHISCKYNNKDVVKKLMTNENINSLNKKKETPLMICLKNGNFEIAYMLLSNEHINVNIVDNNNNTLLTYMLINHIEDEKMFDLLFKNKAYIENEQLKKKLLDHIANNKSFMNSIIKNGLYIKNGLNCEKITDIILFSIEHKLEGLTIIIIEHYVLNNNKNDLNYEKINDILLRSIKHNMVNLTVKIIEYYFLDNNDSEIEGNKLINIDSLNLSKDVRCSLLQCMIKKNSNSKKFFELLINNKTYIPFDFFKKNIKNRKIIDNNVFIDTIIHHGLYFSNVGRDKKNMFTKTPLKLSIKYGFIEFIKKLLERYNEENIEELNDTSISGKTPLMYSIETKKYNISLLIINAYIKLFEKDDSIKMQLLNIVNSLSRNKLEDMIKEISILHTVDYSNIKKVIFNVNNPSKLTESSSVLNNTKINDKKEQKYSKNNIKTNGEREVINNIKEKGSDNQNIIDKTLKIDSNDNYDKKNKKENAITVPKDSKVNHQYEKKKDDSIDKSRIEKENNIESNIFNENYDINFEDIEKDKSNDDYNELLLSLSKEDYDRVLFLLKNGNFDKNYINKIMGKKKLSLLMVLLIKDKYDLIQLWFNDDSYKNIIDVNIKDMYNNTPFVYMLKHSKINKEVYELLISSGAYIDITLFNDNNFIQQIINNDVFITLFIDKKIRVKGNTSEINTIKEPLIFSINTNNYDFVKTLIKYNISIDETDQNNNDPLMIANRSDNKKIKKLVKSYFKSDKSRVNNGLTNNNNGIILNSNKSRFNIEKEQSKSNKNIDSPSKLDILNEKKQNQSNTTVEITHGKEQDKSNNVSKLEVLDKKKHNKSDTTIDASPKLKVLSKRTQNKSDKTIEKYPQQKASIKEKNTEYLIKKINNELNNEDSVSQFLYYCESGSKEKVKVLLRNWDIKNNINEKDNKGNTAIIYMLKSSIFDEEIYDLFIKNGGYIEQELFNNKDFINQIISNEKFIDLYIRKKIWIYNGNLNPIKITEPLIFAIKINNIEFIKVLMNHNISTNEIDNKNNDPIMVANSLGNKKIKKLIRNYGKNTNQQSAFRSNLILVNPNELDEENITKLDSLGETLNTEENGIELITEDSSNLNNNVDEENNNIDENYKIPIKKDSMNKQDKYLMISIKINSIKNVKNAIKTGADINRENQNGLTPLILSILLNNNGVVKLLIKHGVRIDDINKNGLTPMDFALIKGNIEIIKSLIEQTKSYSENERFKKLIDNAILNKNGTALKYIIKQETDIVSEIIDDYKIIVDILVSHRICINVNKHKPTPRNFVLTKGNIEIVQSLIKQTKSYTGNKNVKKLIDNAIRDKNDTALKHIIEQETNIIDEIMEDYKNIAELLISNGVCINDTNKNGDTSMVFAFTKANFEIIQSLIKETKIYTKKEGFKRLIYYVIRNKKLIDNEILNKNSIDNIVILNIDDDDENMDKKVKEVKKDIEKVIKIRNTLKRMEIYNYDKFYNNYKVFNNNYKVFKSIRDNHRLHFPQYKLM